MGRLIVLLLALALARMAVAEPVAARLDGFEIDEGWWGRVTLRLPLAAAVPWTVRAASDPSRVVVEADGVDWRALAAARDMPVPLSVQGDRLSVGFDGPMVVERAQMTAGADGAVIEVVLVPGDPVPASGPVNAVEAPDPDDPLIVALDPGHGGHDPGAEGGGTTEAALMLTFAGELAAILQDAGHAVVLTRDDDRFLGLRGRPSAARAGAADILLSLHADAVPGGGAAGATVYTLSDIPSDALSAEIVARQGRDDLIRGVDLEVPGDEVARVLVEMARTDTAPRSDTLADALVRAMGAAEIKLHKRPRLGGAFTVLKAPDMPSVLVELGFMSDPGDVANLLDPAWRARMAQAIATGVAAWAEADAARAGDRRR